MRGLTGLKHLAVALIASVAAPLLAQNSVLIENIGPNSDAILVENGVIVAQGDPAAFVTPDESEVIDAGGAYALPGLIDMHVHVWGEAELAAYLAHGVTTVRNLSGMPFHLRMAQEVEEGILEGPRLLTSGPILNSPGPNQQINHQIVTTREEAMVAVKAQHDAGFTRIKVYSNLDEAAYGGVLEAAAEYGMRITGHTPEGTRLDGIPHRRDFLIAFNDIIDDGFETIEHVESIAFHGLRERQDHADAVALAQRIAEAGVPVTATLLAHRNLVKMARSNGAFANRPGTQWLNPVIQATEAETISFWSGQDPSHEQMRGEFYAWFTAELFNAGATLVAGSDAGIFSNIPGVSLYDELELLVEAGLTPADAINTATVNAAKALGEEGRLGCLDVGCVADIVLFASDPRASIDNLRTPVAVMRAGRWYSQDDLHGLLRKAAQHDREQIVADLLEGMAAQGTPLDPSVFAQ